MKLLGKRILILVSDGVEEQEYLTLKQAFEQESAEVFSTSPQDYMTVETVHKFHRGKDISIDFPIEAVEAEEFDGLIIPDGLLSTDILRRDERVIELIHIFRQYKLPIFASGRAVAILHESQAFPRDILVRDTDSLSSFIEQAIDILVEGTSTVSSYPQPSRA